MSSAAFTKVKADYSQVGSIASIFEKYGGVDITPKHFLPYCQEKYKNGRVPTDEEKAIFNEVRVAVDEQFVALCNVTMLQECHALSASIPEENELKTKIADHDRDLGELMNGIYEEWSHFSDEVANDGEEATPTTAITIVNCGFDEVAEQKKADEAKQEYEQWLQANDGKIHEVPSDGCPLGISNKKPEDASNTNKVPVGHFVKFSAHIHPSTGKVVTITIGGDKGVLRIARTVDPLHFQVREPLLCGGDGRTMTWYVQAVAGGSAHVDLVSSWRGDEKGTSTTKLEVVV